MSGGDSADSVMGWGCIPRTYSDGFCFKQMGGAVEGHTLLSLKSKCEIKEPPSGKLIWNTKMEVDGSDDFPDFKGVMFRFQI